MERGTIYPSWRYHVDGRSVLCRDAAQDADLEDWSDADVRDFSPKQPISTHVNAKKVGFDAHVDLVPTPDGVGTTHAPEPKRKPGRPRKDA